MHRAPPAAAAMYEPVKPSGYGIAVFTAIVAAQSFLSLSVHFGSDNLFSMMVPHTAPPPAPCHCPHHRAPLTE